MFLPLRRAVVTLLLCLGLAGSALASAYNAHPKLVVIIVIDQFRGDYPERYHEQFTDGGFRLLLDHGAYFPDCNYDYANTVTAAGHATLVTGAYSNGHGIISNEWWDPAKKKKVTSVEDDSVKLLGLPGKATGSSPHNLLADTLGDELKLATQGNAKVFTISLKDRSSVLPGGFSANAAYWIDAKSGAWVTSTYYMNELPMWVQEFNSNKRGDKYLNQDWKDADGNVLRSTKPEAGKSTSFYDLVGPTPLGNDYELEFARELITYEKLAEGPATNLLVISLSANDILGHKVGPDAPAMQAMALALDRQLNEFFGYLGHQIGLANLWIALSADHGVAPLPGMAQKLRLPAANSDSTLRASVNRILSSRFAPGRSIEFVREIDHRLTWLNEDAFTSLKIKEADAERATGEALVQAGMRGYYTRSDLAAGAVPNTEAGRRYEHSYSPLGGWYVFSVTPPFQVGSATGTDHGSPYTYDTHVPLAFYGIPFQPGTYHTHAEPVDLAVTLASLLGINAPTHAIGRVLNESFAPARRAEALPRPNVQVPVPKTGDIQPVSVDAAGLR